MLKHVKVFGHKNGFYTKTSSEDENIKREFCFKLKTNVQLDLFLLIKLKNTCSYKHAIVKEILQHIALKMNQVLICNGINIFVFYLKGIKGM